jgi:ComF family protein
MHQFKYRGNKELGLQLGRMMGDTLHRSGRFEADALVPLPLFASRERRRGFNQAAILCKGMAEVLRVPVLEEIISRSQYTDTQTKKGRVERWLNMEGKFILERPEDIGGKHILLVDDVVTTGATLEACGTELLKAQDVQLSIAALCYATRS